MAAHATTPEHITQALPRLSADMSAGAMVRARGLGRRFGENWAVRDVDLELAPGEVVGLLGPNGAGKTTTVRMLTALLAPSAGDASIDGIDVRADPDTVRARVGLLTETPSLYERLSAWENLEFFGRLNRVGEPARSQRIEHWLRLFELWDRRHDRVGGFSKGMKQKVAIARALIHEPVVLFLDEPTSGLDPEAAHVVREAMADLKRQSRTIVLATHNLDEAERLADRVAFLRGRILRVDSPERLRRTSSGPTVEVVLAGAPPHEVLDVVRALPFVASVANDGPALRVGVRDRLSDTPSLIATLVGTGAALLSVAEVTPSLEQVYFDVFGLRPGANGGH